LRIDLIVSLGCTPSSACDAFVSKPLDVLANVVIEGIDLVTVLFRLFGGFCGRDSGIGPAQRAKTTIWN
jgi:hypothetical protein